MYLHLVGSEQFGKSNFVFAVQETFGTYYLLFTIFRKPHSFTRTFTSGLRKICAFMEAKSLFTELLIVVYSLTEAARSVCD